MTAPDVADVLPLRPADGPQDALPKYSNARTTPAGPRTRVEKTTDGLGMWLKIQTALGGASLLDATPPALLLIWERHCTAAKAWDHKLLRGPRYAWGAVHVTMIAPVFYFIVWATDSIPKAFGTLLTIATILLWFPHFSITITI